MATQPNVPECRSGCYSGPACACKISCCNCPACSLSLPLQVGDATVPFRPELERHRLTPRHTAYLRVAEGCNHACTFCAIPGFRC